MGGVKKIYYKWNKKNLKQALRALQMNEMSLNRISLLYSVPKPTILRHARNKNKIANVLAIHKGRPTTFNAELENIIVNYILQFEKHMFGLTITDVRKLAFDVAEKHKIPHKFNKGRQMAGKAWFYAFKGRHSEITIGPPKHISLNRIKGFNKLNVNGFCDFLEMIIEENGLSATKIFNVDECNFSNEQKKPRKVGGLKNKKHIGANTSRERSVNVTAVCCANVAGDFVPPMLIFKRTRPKNNPKLTNVVPQGSLVTVTESGYINSTLFVEWMKHFVHEVKPSPENKILILLDGETIHCKNLGALDLANENGIIMLQLPRYSTHRVQPLNGCFIKPMRTHYIEAVEKWLQANPGSQLTQYQVACVIAEAYEQAAIVSNISNGFKETGVWPVNKHGISKQIIRPARNLDASSIEHTNNESIKILQDSVISLSKDKEKNSLKQSTSNDDVCETKANTKKENLPAVPLGMQLSTVLPHRIDRHPSTTGLKTKSIRISKSVGHGPIRTKQKKNTLLKATKIISSPYKIKSESVLDTDEYNKELRSKNTDVDKITNKYTTVKKEKALNNTSISEKKDTTVLKRRRSYSSSSEDYAPVVLELSDSDHDNDATVCALCDGSYYDKNTPNVDWFQCVRCRKWVHVTVATVYNYHWKKK